MARVAEQLGVAELAKIRKSGRHACGKQLYMELTKAGRRHWLVRYTYKGKPTWQVLGPVDTGRWTASLHAARQRAAEALEALGRGEDPRTLKPAPAAKSAAFGRITFGRCLDEFISLRAPGWTNARYAAQTETTLRAWTASIARRPVADISVSEIKALLAPHWHRVPVKAARMREKIAGVFAYAIGQEWRTAGNPADVKVMGDVLPTVRREQEPYKALPWEDLPKIMERLAAIDTPTSRALQFCFLTVTRSVEARGARWPEIDLDGKVWTIPKSRMKKGRAHRVPLSREALAVLDRCPRQEGQPLVFGPLEASSLYRLLVRGLGVPATVHGVRSAFFDWTQENKICSADVADAALSHEVKKKTTRAYYRSDLFKERIAVMERWAFYLST